MINPFTISKNKRYILDGKTVIIEEVLPSDIAWYYLDEWWNNQNKNPNLYSSSRWWFVLNAKRYV